MTVSDKVLEIRASIAPDQIAAFICNTWNNYYDQMASIRSEWLETQKYIFATDTSSTSNQSLPWKNSTTLPKLTQIRDNLHSNYLSAIFPNNKWLQWTAYTRDAASKKKAEAIQAYMENKTRESNYRTTVSRLILDYIDYGNAFVTATFEKRYNNQPTEITPAYVGPLAVRIDPKDIVFNPLADKFENTYKIVRSIKTLGELKRLAETQPDEHGFWTQALNRRQELQSKLGSISREDFEVAEMYSVDGFGNLYDYYQSQYMEILEFYGDYHDQATGALSTGRMITCVDRSYVIRNVPIPTFSGRAPIRHVGWRLRPNNLWAMSPLANLVGMQYRIDHLENLKADAMDLAVLPPLAIVGEVEEFKWGPGVEIHLGENGTINEVSKNINAIITADTQIKDTMDMMELMAGAPREAMGVRTPGEKTALEIQTLTNAAGRIFQEKASNFELNLLEPNLNDQLETAVRNFDGSDIIRTISDIGAIQFKTITKADITASGVLRPVGARHFAQQAQELQNLIGIFNSPIGQIIRPHTSALALADFVENVTNIQSYDIFSPNIAIMEMHETQALANQSGEDQQVSDAMPNTPPDVQPNLTTATLNAQDTRYARQGASQNVGADLAGN